MGNRFRSVNGRVERFFFFFFFFCGPDRKEKVLRIVLAARAQSPAVEMHRSLAMRDAPPDFNHSEVDSAFALVGSSLRVASVSELDTALLAARDDKSGLIVEGDHVYGGGGDRKGVVVVVYGNLGTPSLKSFHDALSKRRDVVYVLRHRPPPSAKRVRVPGFGVEMQLKSTEYKVVDDNAATPAPAPARSSSSSSSSQNEDQDFELEPVPKAEVAQLGVKIAQAIASASHPLEMLQRLSQNFPTECHLFRKQLVNESFVASIEKMQMRVQRGHTAVLVNGRHVPVENVNFFELITIVGQEIRRVSELAAVPGVDSKAVRSLSLRGSAQAAGGGGGGGGEAVVPYFDVRSAHLFWVNDIEHDALYRSWRKSLQGFLVQQWPGQPYLVGRNVFHIVFVMDLASPDALAALLPVWSVVGSMERGTLGAARLGIVPVGSSPHSIMLAKAWRVLVLEDPHHAMGLLEAALTALNSPSSKAVESVVENHLARVGLTLDLLMESEESYPGTQASNAWCASFGFPSPSVAPLHVFVNGKRVELDDASVPPLHAVARLTMEMTREVQMAVYQRRLQDSEDDIHGWWLQAHQAQRAFSAYGGASDVHTPYVALTKPHAWDGIQKHLHFVSTQCNPFCALNYVVVIDVGSRQGLGLAQSALDRLRTPAKEQANSIRMAFVWHSSCESDAVLSSQLEAALRAGKLDEASVLLEYALAGHSHPHVKITSEGQRLRDARTLEESLAFVSGLFGAALPSSRRNAVILNGRVFGLPHDGKFGPADFSVVEAHEWRTRAEAVSQIIYYGDESSKDPAEVSLATMLVCSVLGADETQGIIRYDMYELLHKTPPSSSTGVGDKEAKIVIDALLDPLSPAGKKFSSILLKILSAFRAEVNLWLNPVLTLSDLPLKQYYRYVASTELRFDSQGAIDHTLDNRALFEGLPTKTLFSMSLDVPDHWVVDAVAAPYDLDNLRIADVGGGASKIGALYELTHLLVEGNCKDVTKGANPQAAQVRGMQLKLASSSGSSESLVMEMGGYFQLKSTPGVWHLSLLGRSAQLFDIVKEEPVVVRSFSGFSRPLEVVRKSVEEMEPLLPPDLEADAKLQRYQKQRRNKNAAGGSATGEQGIFGSIFGGKKDGSGGDDGDDAGSLRLRTVAPSNATINVFSLASGHLYERFLSIMMYTARRVTKAPLKFWFLKQFLSPQFKRSLPALSAKYGFDFELVTYHWPRWLRHQTEKQRVIWGYKILFLDVLFPLDVERVIFVDADQIVREDLNTLHTLDLEGAPYAFTPFCSLPHNRRLETKGFRFWESGYWKDTLDGLPYHISALFVVDLKRFRQLAAGDALRGAYHQLSADPNSLANLDQDLPNVLQRQLPMFSLPEEWLWCGTWCTDESLAVAKSIDLCQNPMTKKSKLEMAKEIDPDWTKWDQELTLLRRSVDATYSKRDDEIISEL